MSNVGVNNKDTFTGTVEKKKQTFMVILRHMNKHVMGITCPHKRWELSKPEKKASLKFEARDKFAENQKDNTNHSGKKKRETFFFSPYETKKRA